MIAFNNPGWLTLFLLFPVIVMARCFWKGRGGQIDFPFSIWPNGGFHPGMTPGRILAAAAAIIFWLGMASLIAAMAGPEIIQQEEIQLSRGLDIMVVLDQSASMGAKDFPPENRFNTAKELIHQFVNSRKSDSIGLVSFGSDALLQSPTTTDRDWFLNRLDKLRLRELGDDTAIGLGLALALVHLSDSTARGKVILLLTDGDDNTDIIRLDTAASLAVENGVKVYCIGIGRPGLHKVELIDPESGQIIWGTTRSTMDEPTLRNMAESTGGAYWKAESPGAMEAAFHTIDTLEVVERRVGIQVISQARHRFFLAVGIISITLAIFIRRIVLREIP